MPTDRLADMSDVFLDAALASAPDARDHVAHLIDAGQHVTFVGGGAEAAGSAFPDVSRLDALPAEPERGSWFVTADPARCAERQAGVRMLLIGPRLGRTPVQSPRCDTEARDLAAAVLEILARDAMG
jgi:hypothetical protein